MHNVFLTTTTNSKERVRDLIGTQQCPCLAWVIQDHFSPALPGGCQSVPFFPTLTGQEQRFTRLLGSSFTAFATEKEMEIPKKCTLVTFFLTVNK